MRIKYTPLLFFVSPLWILLAAAYLQWAMVGVPSLSQASAHPDDISMAQGYRPLSLWKVLKKIYQGEGGYNEDHEYFGELANI